MEAAEKFLASVSIRPFEVDDEEVVGHEWKASSGYNTIAVLEKIGEEDFKPVFLTCFAESTREHFSDRVSAPENNLIRAHYRDK